MSLGTGKTALALALLASAAAAMPAAAARQGAVETGVATVRGEGATAAASVNVLTVSDQRQIDNRITAWVSPAGRLVLSAPEGLGDPDGSDPNCKLDNGKTGEPTATEVSCAPGYIGAIVGSLGGGNDVLSADPNLAVLIGGVINGERRPLSGGSGRDRLVGGAVQDLIDGGAGADSVVGGGGDDGLSGGSGPDRLSGGSGRDLCRGGGGSDRAKGCEQKQSVP
jgi:hypothetical protein